MSLNFFNDLEIDMSGNDVVFFNLNETDLMFVKPLFTIYRLQKFKYNPSKWIPLKFRENTGGYLVTKINKKEYRKHRLIYFAYNQDWDIDNNCIKTNVIDHIDGDKLNNNIENLRNVTHQQNQWNRTKAKGYCWDNTKNKWKASICIDGKNKHLGYYTTETDAREAYLNVKHIYHPIP